MCFWSPIRLPEYFLQTWQVKVSSEWNWEIWSLKRLLLTNDLSQESHLKSKILKCRRQWLLKPSTWTVRYGQKAHPIRSLLWILIWVWRPEFLWKDEAQFLKIHGNLFWAKVLCLEWKRARCEAADSSLYATKLQLSDEQGTCFQSWTAWQCSAKHFQVVTASKVQPRAEQTTLLSM